ncbi:MAG: DNA-directed RNA polymerase subunit omega [Bacillota bacterium]|nr:DNA-directed RNA polymerase subunit omega [Bacillota bacterium]
MIEPAIGELMKKMDSRYTLVVAAAKRARQLADGAHKLTKCSSDKAVTVAVNEISENKIAYVRTKSGIK